VTDAWTPPASLSDFAQLDHDRRARRGYPEAVLCESKRVDQLVAIAADIRVRDARTLFTRVLPEQAEALLTALPGSPPSPRAASSWSSRRAPRTSPWRGRPG
jgi:hypothetical protein